MKFYDKGKYAGEFNNRVAVHCPKCDQQAFVLSEGNRWQAKHVRVSCMECGYNEKWKKSSWSGPSFGHVRRRRRYCGRWLEKKIKGLRHSYEVKFQCPGYRTEMIEPISWQKMYRPGAYGLPTFPWTLSRPLPGQGYWVG